jgi:hypothetical protein
MTSIFSHNAARILLAWLAGSGALLAQSGVEVRSPSAKLLDTAPGRIVTASVVVANRGEAGEFVERLTLPPGCQKVAPPDLPFRLESGGQTVRVLAIAIPDNMPAGLFTIRYVAQGRRDPSSIGSLDFSLKVTPVDKLELVVEPGPMTAIGGDNYPIKLRVTNRGNSRLAAHLAHRSSLKFAVTMEATDFALEAGETRELLCRVQTDKAFVRHTGHAVTFDLTATTAAGTTLTASQASVVEIIPLVNGKREPYHELPMQLRLIGIAEAGRAPQSQMELAGAGSLDEAGRQRVDFLFRGPEAQKSSLFGERDEYGATYEGEHWKFDLGDRVFSLSPLTEKHSLGRGAGVTWHDGKTTAGAFMMSTRYRQQNALELGAFVREQLTPELSVQGNVFRKTGAVPGATAALPQDIATLETHYRRAKLIDADLEAGFSRSADGVVDFAWRAEAHGQLPGKVTYALEHAHAGPNFHGYYSDSDTTYASVAQAITPRFRVHASASFAAGNLALNDVRSSVVNREQSWNAGANYELSKRTGVSLEWLHTGREDILAPAAYDFTEDAARAGVSHTFGKLQFQSFIDLGTLDNTLTGGSGPFQRYSGAVNWRPTARQAYSVSASYGPSAYTGASERALSASVSAHWQVRDNLDANLSVARNQYDGLIGREQDQALASVSYRFANKSLLSVIGRWSRASSQTADAVPLNESALLVSYTVPFSVPVSRKTSIGALKGRVADPATSAGVPRVVVQIGEQFAVTDEAGNFEFPGLKPGRCELRVVQDSLGPQRAITTALPMPLQIRPGDTTRVALTAAAACSISVRVVRYAFTDGSALKTTGELKEAGGLGGAAVEISNGRETWRAQTDRTGGASFQRLPPGRWSVRIASDDLPPLHTVEKRERSLTIAPGASEEISVRVLPQRRTIRMLDHGAVAVSG